jgi:hypothetical protein
MMPVPPSQAYSRLRRVKDAFAFIKGRAASGPGELERTQSKHVSQTYGLNDVELVKRIKARFRNELSFSGDGK